MAGVDCFRFLIPLNVDITTDILQSLANLLLSYEYTKRSSYFWCGFVGESFKFLWVNFYLVKVFCVEAMNEVHL